MISKITTDDVKNGTWWGIKFKDLDTEPSNILNYNKTYNKREIKKNLKK